MKTKGMKIESEVLLLLPNNNAATQQQHNATVSLTPSQEAKRFNQVSKNLSDGAMVLVQVVEF